MGYERDNIARLTGYVPGEQPQTDQPIKLNTNENPYPPVQPIVDAIHAVPAEQLRRYPSPRADRFREAAARVHGVTADQVIATNGGDELLRLAITVFCEPSGQQGRGGLGVAAPGYSLDPILAAIHDTPVSEVPLEDGTFALPGDFADRLNGAGCNLAMIVNPHAPSGRLESLDTLRHVARTFRGVLLVDEAYVDFATSDALPLVRGGDLDNVLLLRSMSKGYSLAGLRFGYGLGHRDLIAALDKARDSYNIDALAQAGATAAIEHREQVRASWQKIIAERQRVRDALCERGWSVLPSESNFLLATPPADGPEARQLYEILKQQAIFVRYFDQRRIADKLRITIGTPAQNDALLSALATAKTAST